MGIQHDNKNNQFIARHGLKDVGTAPANSVYTFVINTSKWEYPNGVTFVPRIYIDKAGIGVPSNYTMYLSLLEESSDNVTFAPIDTNRLIGTYVGTRNTSQNGLQLNKVVWQNKLGVIGQFKEYVRVSLTVDTPMANQGAGFGFDILLSPRVIPFNTVIEQTKV